MKVVLIDTDVILDFFFDRKPFSKEATLILSLCEQGKIKGYVTSIMISNVYYLLRKTSTHQKVLDNLKMLMKIVDVLSTNKEVVLKSLSSDFKDFEDALQNFSAHNKQEVYVIITRNIVDYKTSNLSIMTPLEYLKTL